MNGINPGLGQARRSWTSAYAGVMALLLCLSFFPPPASAKDREAQKAFEEANAQYEKNEIDAAFTGYNALASQGFGGPALFYNLGNAHFRRGERGRAVLWYERAARLAPRDSDVRFNLSIARSHIKSEADSLFRRAATYFTENELAVATAIFSALFSGSLVSGRSASCPATPGRRWRFW